MLCSISLYGVSNIPFPLDNWIFITKFWNNIGNNITTVPYTDRLSIWDHWNIYFPIDRVYDGSTSDLTLNDEFDIFWGNGEYLKVVALVVRNNEYKLLYDIGNL